MAFAWWRWFNISTPVWHLNLGGHKYLVKLFQVFNRHDATGDHYWGIGLLQVGSRHLLWLGNQGREARRTGIRLLVLWIGSTG